VELTGKDNDAKNDKMGKEKKKKIKKKKNNKNNKISTKGSQFCFSSGLS
jgi:hypothetical protein